MSDFTDQIETALIRLIKACPKANNTVGFEFGHDGQSGFKTPVFFATSNQLGGWFLGKTPDAAVSRLLRDNNITRVEEYIRAKEYKA